MHWVDFYKLKSLPDYLTCTDRLQQWNQPRGRHVPPIPMEKLGSCRRELVIPKERAYGSKMVFDPRPLNLRSPDPKALEILNIIVPSLDSIQHDHCYYSLREERTKITQELKSDLPLSENILLEEKRITKEDIIRRLTLTMDERNKLEESTREQSATSQWHEVRQIRTTGSKCGRLLIQKEKTPALLQSCLYSKPMLHLPKAIAWGRDNECRARLEYVSFMKENGHPDLEASPAGFVVHPSKCRLVAAPDA